TEVKHSSEIISDLNKSLNEEVKAEDDYHKRSLIAREKGDIETAELFTHISQEEMKHANEFKKRIEDLGGKPEFIPDSPEFLAETIQDSGWREQLDQAFLAAVGRTKGG
ncbi:MAG: ferritin-like domain-containing protein, partial [Dehalococcoidales bacterium]|nr:ferritin-like domain-containing protein [Dehalococcoidales bacterium]